MRYIGGCGHPVRACGSGAIHVGRCVECEEGRRGFSGPPADDAAMGRRLRAVRRARGKSQVVIAGLAGISSGYLSRLENGLRSLDRLSLIVALAHALEIPPTELVIDLWSGDNWTRTKDRDARALAGVGQR